LLFLKEFSTSAFLKQYRDFEQKWIKEIESKEESNDLTPDFDVFLTMQESMFIEQIVKHVSSTEHTTAI
jgi:hypothetical protein